MKVEGCFEAIGDLKLTKLCNNTNFVLLDASCMSVQFEQDHWPLKNKKMELGKNMYSYY